MHVYANDLVRGARHLIAVSALLGLLAAACGGSTSTAKAGPVKPELQDYCTKVLAIETFPEPDFSTFDSLTPAQQGELVKRFTGQLVPLGEQVVSASPATVKADGALQLDALRKASQTGDPSGLEEPPVKAAEARTHSFDLANCGWAKADVTAREYSYAGVPKSVTAGPFSIQLSNKGTVAHDMNLFRVNDGVTESVKAILALPDDEAMRKITIVGTTFVAPGDTDYRVAMVTKGVYGIACLVPLGDNHDGPPHASRGMYATFTVR